MPSMSASFNNLKMTHENVDPWKKKDASSESLIWTWHLMAIYTMNHH